LKSSGNAGLLRIGSRLRGTVVSSLNGVIACLFDPRIHPEY
jgi:hypothetical protein